MPVNGSASEAISGTSRRPCALSVRSPCCHDGIVNNADSPPPDPYHAATFAGWVGSGRLVPPTPTTHVDDAGKSTVGVVASAVLVSAAQSKLPSSPLAAKTVTPWPTATS